MKQLFDLESVYDNEISPLMRQIIDICKQHEMPMVCSFAFQNDADDGVGACTTVLNGFDGRHHKPYALAMNAIRGGASCTAFTIVTDSREVPNV